MSPYRTNNANVFIVWGSSNPGQLNNTSVDASGVVRLSNFSLEKEFFHNLVYCRKNLGETNIILCL